MEMESVSRAASASRDRQCGVDYSGVAGRCYWDSLTPMIKTSNKLEVVQRMQKL